MTLSVITGSLSGDFRIVDPWGSLIELIDKGIFVRQYWNGSKWVSESRKKQKVISGFNGTNKGEIIQTTGAGKTNLAVLHLYQYHLWGFLTAGNLRLGWTLNNKNKPKKEWTAVIRTMKDFEKLYNTRFLLDDIRGTIASWNTKEANMIVELSNATRKKKNKGIITTQRMKYVPPDMRDIIDDVYVPFIRSFDMTRTAPDGRWYPIDMYALHFTSGYEFLDYKYYNLTDKACQIALNSFDTEEIATGLTRDREDSPDSNQPGHELEVKAFEYLKEKVPGEKWQHLNGKMVFDIISECFAIDVTSTDPDGKPYTEHKDLTRHIRTAKAKGQKPYLMFPYRGSWGFVPINYHLNDRVGGKRIDIQNTNIRTLETIMKK